MLPDASRTTLLVLLLLDLTQISFCKSLLSSVALASTVAASTTCLLTSALCLQSRVRIMRLRHLDLKFALLSLTVSDWSLTMVTAMLSFIPGGHVLSNQFEFTSNSLQLLSSLHTSCAIVGVRTWIQLSCCVSQAPVPSAGSIHWGNLPMAHICMLDFSTFSGVQRSEVCIFFPCSAPDCNRA